MKAERIPGKPGKTERERVVDLETRRSGLGEGLVLKSHVLAILDCTEEPEPDLITVTMTFEEAVKEIWRPGAVAVALSSVLAQDEVYPLTHNAPVSAQEPRDAAQSPRPTTADAPVTGC